MKSTKKSPSREKKGRNRVYYAVIDTNVLVSYFFKKDSNPGWIVEKVKSGVIIPLLCDEILKEYYEVLTRNKFDFPLRDIEGTIGQFITRGLMLDRSGSEDFFIDKDDIVFYEIAITGRKSFEAKLVTGNTKHFPKKEFIVTPTRMREIIEKRL